MPQDTSAVLRQITASVHACRDCVRVKEIDVTAADVISVLLCGSIVLILLSTEGKSYVYSRFKGRLRWSMRSRFHRTPLSGSIWVFSVSDVPSVPSPLLSLVMSTLG